MRSNMKLTTSLGLSLLTLPTMALAEDTLSAGDTAWMLTSTVLVLMMTIPGLSLFYAGMVRSKNALSLMMQCFTITCLITVLWVLYGYSLAFEDGGAAQMFVGEIQKRELTTI